MTVTRLLAALLAAVSGPLATAQSGITLLPAKDTTLYQSATGSLANGGGTAIFIGRSAQANNSIRRALLQFDVSSIPANATLIGAWLELFVEQASDPNPANAFVHRVNAAWQEGTVVAPGSEGSGGPAIAGETTWLHTNFPNTFWNSAGGDFVAAPSLTFQLPSSGSVLTGTSATMIADVEAWRQNPGANFGWLIKTDETQSATSRRCTSRHGAGGQPRLHISYLMPGQTGLAGQGCPVGGSATQLFGLGIQVGPATGGTSIGLTYVTGPSNSVGATLLSLGFDPIGIELFPNCSLFLQQPVVAGNAWLMPAGFAQDAFTIPLNSPGFLVAVQGVAIDSNPAGFTLSNVGLMLTQ